MQNAKCKIKMQNQNAKSKCKIKMKSQSAKSKCKIKMQSQSAKSKCQNIEIVNFLLLFRGVSKKAYICSPLPGHKNHSVTTIYNY